MRRPKSAVSEIFSVDFNDTTYFSPNCLGKILARDRLVATYTQPSVTLKHDTGELWETRKVHPAQNTTATPMMPFSCIHLISTITQPQITTTTSLQQRHKHHDAHNTQTTPQLWLQLDIRTYEHDFKIDIRPKIFRLRKPLNTTFLTKIPTRYPIADPRRCMVGSGCDLDVIS